MKFSVPPVFQSQVKKAILEQFKGVEKSEQYCVYRLDIAGVRVKQYTNGTFYLEGDQASVEKISAIAHAVMGKVPASTPTVTIEKKALPQTYIGTDESGKGDYFGPLVIAGVYVTPQSAGILKELGVADSKTLTDSRMKQLAVQIQQTVGKDAWHVIDIGPERYNALYMDFKRQGKTLNDLLAWGHAQIIEALLEKNPTCRDAIADQFGSEHYIQGQLKTLGQGITLHQMHRAEANTGVAAASILARVRFVEKLETLGNQFNLRLPLGAGSPVLAAGKAFVRTHSADALVKVAKLHFKTTATLH